MVPVLTQADAQPAVEDWEPAVALRPSPMGLEANVRYITRAPQRNAVKARLFKGIVELLHRPVLAAGAWVKGEMIR